MRACASVPTGTCRQMWKGNVMVQTWCRHERVSACECVQACNVQWEACSGKREVWSTRAARSEPCAWCGTCGAAGIRCGCLVCGVRPACEGVDGRAGFSQGKKFRFCIRTTRTTHGADGTAGAMTLPAHSGGWHGHRVRVHWHTQRFAAARCPSFRLSAPWCYPRQPSSKRLVSVCVWSGYVVFCEGKCECCAASLPCRVVCGVLWCGAVRCGAVGGAVLPNV